MVNRGKRLPIRMSSGRLRSIATRGAFLLFVSVVIVLSVACDNTSPKESDADIARKIIQMESDAMERWRQGDPTGWLEISAPGIVYFDPTLDRPIRGIESYRNYMDGLKGQIFFDGAEFLNPDVKVYGETAIYTYNFTSFRKDKEGNVQHGPVWNTTEVYALLEGEWKIVHTHWAFLKGQPVQRAQP